MTAKRDSGNLVNKKKKTERRKRKEKKIILSLKAMDGLQKDKMLLYNDNTLEAVRKPFNLDKPKVIEDLVNILEEWVKEQHHFTNKNFDRRYLEMMILAGKGSIERAKMRLDRACTFRTMTPELFCIYDIREFFKLDLECMTHAFLPKMTKDYGRVYFLRNVGKKFEPTTVKTFIKLVPHYCEYVRLRDYADGYYLVLDYTEANIADLLTKITISDMQALVTFLLDCCGFRVKACYFISSSKLIEAVVAIVKQIVSAKLFKRVHVLKTREELQNVIDKDILPIEYGGSEKPLKELHEQWLDVLTSEDYMAYLRDMNSACTDESLRQKAVFNDQYMGMPGTFRMLSVD